MKFTRLRLSGFKSFVEPTELYIEPGLTAIVGPNGCGKSNLFDALRWVMGETRPTSIRGAEMDDVIFGGSAGRPARNTAEVMLFIDNQDRSAPGAYNDYDSIEVSRRIEREAGSAYRINGRDVRQRDVQIFFADASSGAGSTAFVRQGQIGLLISQKPLARRAILEEAAGIAGLHQRRHEAELRLRAAETNLSRLDDIIREIEGQLQNLKRQARQAARYRNLSGLIRKAEALAHYLRWSAAELQARAAQEALAASSNAVTECTDRAAIASTAQAEAATTLPPLRQTEAERSAALHRLVVERDALDAEERRAREEAQRLRQRIAQTEQDLAREQGLSADAEAAVEKLAAEAAELEAQAARAEEELTLARDRAAEFSDALSERERALDRLNAELAEWHAQKSGHERTREVAAALAETSALQLEEAQARLDRAMEDAAAAPDVRAAEEAADAARIAAEGLRDALVNARVILDGCEGTETAARQPLEDAEREAQRLSAEAKALSDLLRPEGQDLWPPLVDAVSVQPGYEAAFAAALGDDLEAPLDASAPHHWRDLGELHDLVPLPAGARAMIELVDAPAALSRRLTMTGLVDAGEGARLQAELKPGQRLVSQRGDLWRWDGYSASADAPSAAAVRLSQRNRLTALETEIVGAKENRARLFEIYSAAKTAAIEAREALRGAEENQRRADQVLIAAQGEAARVARAAAERASRLASLESEIRRLTETRDAARESERHASEALTALADGAQLGEAVAAARAATAEARAADSDARASLEGLTRASEARAARLGSIADERTRWDGRRAAAAEHISEHNRRREEMGVELVALDALPDEIAAKRNALLDTIAVAEAARAEASDARQQAENVLSDADKAVKAADAALGHAREERARAQALSESAQERIAELHARIRDELDATPEQLPEMAEIKEGHELPDLEHADARVEKLKREREQLGGVNLRAEEEAAEHELRMNTLVADRDDLVGAIDRLRRGIQSLNREGRERLIESFEKVNTNFQMLFTKLFEGGEAKLTMSRMHRLFGVTMAERGVSQLVSVTLAEAERVAAAE